MSSHTPIADGVTPPTAGLTPLEQSCLALSARLDNTAQVLAALASSAHGKGGEHFERRLILAAAKIAEVVNLLGDGTADDAPVLGLTPGVPAFHGRNDLTSLVDFVSLLSHMGRNGVLEVHTEKGPFTLQLENGCVVFATGGNSVGMRLGDILVEQGAVTEEQLDAAFAEKRPNEVIGDLLLRLELVNQNDLDTALTRQMSQLFGRMHEVGTGFEFVFEENRHVLKDSHIRQGTSMMLLEGARLLDEGALWRKPGENDDPDGLGATWLADFGEEQEDDFLDVETFRSFVELLMLEEKLDLVCLPEKAGQFFTTCWRQDADIEVAAAMIEREPILCAHLLRLVGPFADETIRDTVKLLGLGKVRDLALFLTLNGRPSASGTWKGTMVSLCRTASIAGEFGALLGASRLDDANHGRTLALLADIGKPVVLSAILDIERECRSCLAPSAVAELLEEYHVKVGTWLVRHWSLPTELVHVVENHHDRGDLTGRMLLESQLALICQELAQYVQAQDRGTIGRLEQLPVFVEAGLCGEELVGLLQYTDQILATVDAV